MQNPGTTKIDGVPLKEYIETRLQALEHYVNVRLLAIEKDTDRARSSMEKRLEGMNEFREALKDTTARLVTRTEMDSRINLVNIEIGYLREFKAMMEGKASQKSVNVAFVLAIAGMALSIILNLL